MTTAMNEARPQVFCLFGVSYGQLLGGKAATAGGSGGGDEPNRPCRPKSAHEADAVAPKQQRKKKAVPSRRRKEPAPTSEGTHECPVCHLRFKGEKAVHGHQRSHPERTWRGMEPPREPPPLDADGKRRPYKCARCGVQFETRQALGGHRANHSGRPGCHWLSMQEAAAGLAPERMPVLPFDLNEPVPEMEEEEAE